MGTAWEQLGIAGNTLGTAWNSREQLGGPGGPTGVASAGANGIGRLGGPTGRPRWSHREAQGVLEGGPGDLIGGPGGLSGIFSAYICQRQIPPTRTSNPSTPPAHLSQRAWLRSRNPSLVQLHHGSTARLQLCIESGLATATAGPTIARPPSLCISRVQGDSHGAVVLSSRPLLQLQPLQRSIRVQDRDETARNGRSSPESAIQRERERTLA